MIGFQMRVEDESCRDILLAQPIKKVVDEGGLACTDFPGEKKQSFAVLNTISQLVQRLLNAGCPVQKSRVGVYVERILAKSKEVLVHG